MIFCRELQNRAAHQVELTFIFGVWHSKNNHQHTYGTDCWNYDARHRAGWNEHKGGEENHKDHYSDSAGFLG